MSLILKCLAEASSHQYTMEGSTADGVSAPLPGRCAFYVVKKKRYCKMIVGSGKTFCGEHANAVRKMSM